MIKYNFHSHSEFCDGKEKLEDYINAAISKGFKAFGFSPHSPLPFENEWSIKEENLDSYIKTAQELKNKYKGKIDIYTGIELDYIPGYSDDFEKITKNGRFDYRIGSVHLVRIKNSPETWFIDGKEEFFFTGIDKHFGGDVKKAVEAFYMQTIEMLQTQKFDIIGHFDKVKMHNKERLFSTKENWYKNLVNITLQEIKKQNRIVELNTRGVYTGKSNEYFPSEEILYECKKLEIPLMISTDSHMPEQIDNHFAEAYYMLKNIGFTKVVTPFFEAEL
ncbi:MAG: histidinol-phosphatase [Bacteroidetes bacterium]|nr:histidinol-phosphatase [Bacteroidota bacterium]